MRGDQVEDDAIAAEIAPCFAERAGKRTDVVVLACTHYPCCSTGWSRSPLGGAMDDPAPAIARRVVQVLGEVRLDHHGTARMVMTAGNPPAHLLTVPAAG